MWADGKNEMAKDVQSESVDMPYNASDVDDYLSDHLKALAKLAERAGKAESAALIALAVISLNRDL